MAGVVRHKLRAAALLEVLISISILMTVLSIGTIIYLKVSASSYTGEMIRAGLLLERAFEETVKSKAYFDEEEERDNITISRTVEKYQGSDNLIYIRLKASNKEQRVLSEKKQLIIADEVRN